MQLCRLVAEENPQLFHRAKGITGATRGSSARRLYFSTNSKDLREPRLVEGSELCVETNLSANNTYDLCVTLLSHFGYYWFADGRILETSAD